MSESISGPLTALTAREAQAATIQHYIKKYLPGGVPDSVWEAIREAIRRGMGSTNIAIVASLGVTVGVLSTKYATLPILSAQAAAALIAAMRVYDYLAVETVEEMLSSDDRGFLDVRVVRVEWGQGIR
jgi:hypothetical protein